jgi:hypothetical protein
MKTVRLIEACRDILEDVQPATVRAVCYRLFVAGLIESMAPRAIKPVYRALKTAREREMIPWDWIVDETREAERVPSWRDLHHFMRVLRRAYRKDRWALQPRLVEVWSEKDTVKGILAPVLHEYGVTFLSLHGYGSSTKVHEEADLSLRDVDRERLVLYVGDFDPSGLHMSEVDITRRLEEYGAEAFTITRVALTRADTLVLTSFPASDKRKDPRYPWFVRNYGDRCWELDAMDPNLLRGKVDVAIRGLLDVAVWNVCKQAEAAQVETFRTVLTAMKRHVGANPI